MKTLSQHINEALKYGSLDSQIELLAKAIINGDADKAESIRYNLKKKNFWTDSDIDRSLTSMLEKARAKYTTEKELVEYGTLSKKNHHKLTYDEALRLKELSQKYGRSVNTSMTKNKYDKLIKEFASNGVRHSYDIVQNVLCVPGVRKYIENLIKANEWSESVEERIKWDLEEYA